LRENEVAPTQISYWNTTSIQSCKRKSSENATE